MIRVDEKSEFTLSIADLIKELLSRDKFLLKIWVNGSELSYEFTEDNEFTFLEETLKVDNGTRIVYLPYDSMVSIVMIYDEDAIAWHLL